MQLKCSAGIFRSVSRLATLADCSVEKAITPTLSSLALWGKCEPEQSKGLKKKNQNLNSNMAKETMKDGEFTTISPTWKCHWHQLPEIRAAPAVSRVEASSMLLSEQSVHVCLFLLLPRQALYLPAAWGHTSSWGHCTLVRLVGRRECAFQQAEKKASPVHSEKCRPSLDN